MTLPSRWPAVLQAVMKGQPHARADRHYPQWHPAPVTGLMNDPNGFIWFAGRSICFISGTRWAAITGINAGGTGVRTICCTGSTSRWR